VKAKGHEEIDMAVGRQMSESTQREEEGEYPHWNRVYITVIIYTICLIVGLWLFSRVFQ
jgi:hypothetical protein